MANILGDRVMVKPVMGAMIFYSKATRARIIHDLAAINGSIAPDLFVSRRSRPMVVRGLFLDVKRSATIEHSKGILDEPKKWL